MMVQNTFSTATHLTGWKQVQNVEIDFASTDVMVLVISATDGEKLKVHLYERDAKKWLKLLKQNLWRSKAKRLVSWLF